MNLRFIDLDVELEARLGKTVSEYFASEGETCFRAREAELALVLCREERVLIALGGGTALGSLCR